MEPSAVYEAQAMALLKEHGRRLRRARKSKRITQTDLADTLGVSRATVHHWEIGENRPLLWYALRVAAILQVDVDTLFPMDPAAVDRRMEVAPMLLEIADHLRVTESYDDLDAIADALETIANRIFE